MFLPFEPFDAANFRRPARLFLIATIAMMPFYSEAQTTPAGSSPDGPSPHSESGEDRLRISGLLVAQAETNSPAIPIDTLREGGVSGFEDSPLSSVFLRSDAFGALHSGWALPLDPGEQVEFELATEEEERLEWSSAAAPGRAIERIETTEFTLAGGRLSTSTTGRYRLTAPRNPGNYPLRLKVTRRLVHGGKSDGAVSVREFEATLLVKAPFNREGNGLIGDTPIGIYPNESGRNVSGFVQQHRELYAPPASFILASPEVESLRISDHFVLGDFVPPMDRGKVSYLALSPRLVELLEAAIIELRPQIGQAGGSNPLVILSAFLSPNQLMQFGAKGVELTLFTRYQYGDGAAVIWDSDGDGRMDDLNHDGVVDIEDARQFADLLSEVQRKLKKFGGIGVEGSPQLPFMPETPYVDVDMRGVASRW